MVKTAFPPSWYADPTRRHELRYWDGSRWTENVSDAGVPGVDPAVPDEGASSSRYVPPVVAHRTSADVGAGRDSGAPAWYRRRPIVIGALLLLVFVAIRVVTSGGDDNSAPPLTPAPAYPGALLGLEDAATGPLAVIEMRSGAEPTERGKVWGTDIAGPHDVWISPDATRTVDERGGITVLGGDPTGDGVGPVHAARFSPDSTRIAFTPREGGTVRIHDLGTGTTTDVLQTKCEQYGAFPAGSIVCGKADQALWIDGGSLLVWHFGGDLPGKVECHGPGIATGCVEPAANTYSIVSTSGAVSASAPYDRTPLAVRGSTVLLFGGQWADLAEVRAGALSPKALPVGAIPRSLSPDGTRVVVPGQPWTIVDIRSGASTPLGTTEAVDLNDPDCAWSPDGQFLAVQGEGDVLVVPISATPGGWTGRTDFALIGWAP